MQRPFVTGAAGFIGSNLVDRLLSSGMEVTGWDNFSSGHNHFLAGAAQNSKFRLLKGDNLEAELLTAAMKDSDFVFHLAANADVRFGLNHPGRDLEQNTVATFHVLEGMRANGIKRIAFSSTGSVYGEPSIVPTPENAPFPIQTSLYAASKVAGECMIQAYCEGFGFEGYIFRFVSILGERYTHGHVFDFFKQLMTDPCRLKVLGDGTQKKSYLYIQDCLSAILHVIGLNTAAKAKHRCEVYNLGTDECCAVRESISWICSRMSVTPSLEFSGGDRGWIGDNPVIFLDTVKVRETGWRSKLSIREAVEKTVDWLDENRWVFRDRP
jgi:UDP-glucose 4-epimerase